VGAKQLACQNMGRGQRNLQMLANFHERGITIPRRGPHVQRLRPYRTRFGDVPHLPGHRHGRGLHGMHRDRMRAGSRSLMPHVVSKSSGALRIIPYKQGLLTSGPMCSGRWPPA